MQAPVRRSLLVNLRLSPSTLDLSEARPLGGGPAEAGARMSVTCTAGGARPAAEVYWNSEPKMDLSDVSVTKRTEGGKMEGDPTLTYETSSTLIFTAMRKLTSLTCYAYTPSGTNKTGQTRHLAKATTVNVRFRPVVKVKKPNHMRLSSGSTAPLSLYCLYEANPMRDVAISWYHNGELMTNFANFGFTAGSPDAALLKLKDGAVITPALAGDYACSAANEIGRSERKSVAVVAVEERPLVKLRVDSKGDRLTGEDGGGVSELLNANVTLHCAPDGFGGKKAVRAFSGVKWYLDGELLRWLERPEECDGNAIHDDYEGEGVVEREIVADCFVDTSSIVLEKVRRVFMGNYSCRGRRLGSSWGAMSEPKELLVLHPPTGAKLERLQPAVIKGTAFQVCVARSIRFAPSAVECRRALTRSDPTPREGASSKCVYTSQPAIVRPLL